MDDSGKKMRSFSMKFFRYQAISKQNVLAASSQKRQTYSTACDWRAISALTSCARLPIAAGSAIRQTDCKALLENRALANQYSAQFIDVKFSRLNGFLKRERGGGACCLASGHANCHYPGRPQRIT